MYHINQIIINGTCKNDRHFPIDISLSVMGTYVIHGKIINISSCGITTKWMLFAEYLEIKLTA